MEIISWRKRKERAGKEAIKNVRGEAALAEQMSASRSQKSYEQRRRRLKSSSFVTDDNFR